MKQLTVRLQTMITDKEFASLQEWMKANETYSQSAAIRELMKRGMRTAKKEVTE